MNGIDLFHADAVADLPDDGDLGLADRVVEDMRGMAARLDPNMRNRVTDAHCGQRSSVARRLREAELATPLAHRSAHAAR